MTIPLIIALFLTFVSGLANLSPGAEDFHDARRSVAIGFGTPGSSFNLVTATYYLERDGDWKPFFQLGPRLHVNFIRSVGFGFARHEEYDDRGWMGSFSLNFIKVADFNQLPFTDYSAYAARIEGMAGYQFPFADRGFFYGGIAAGFGPVSECFQSGLVTLYPLIGLEGRF